MQPPVGAPYRLAITSLAALISLACSSSEPAGGHHDPAVTGVDSGPERTPIVDASTPMDAPATNPLLDAGTPEDGSSVHPGEPDASPLGDGSAPVCHGAGARFATGVVAHQFGPGQNLGQNLFPTPVLGPPKGGGACSGSTDTISLGNGGFMELEFRGNAIVDGPGPDFIVFENPFEVDCNPSNIFAELGTVSVSEDGVTWTDFPCTATKPPYGMCSGWHIVNANADTNTIDPTDPTVAGGDAYDLADIGVHAARYVRVTDRADLVGQNGVYDLDAVSIVHPMCP